MPFTADYNSPTKMSTSSSSTTLRTNRRQPHPDSRSLEDLPSPFHSLIADMGTRALRRRSGKTAVTTSRPTLWRLLPTFALMGFLCFMVFVNRIAFSNQRSLRLMTDEMPKAEQSSMKVTASSTTEINPTVNAGDNDGPDASNPKILTPSFHPPEKSFLEAAKKTGTDKVKGLAYLPECLKDDTTCTRPSCERENCRPWGHFYHTMYQQRLGKYSLPSTEPFQLLEIGFNYGWGYEAFQDFFSEVQGAEFHSIEISCIEQGPREEGKWPWGNFANASKDYDMLREKNLLHCGDASNVTWLDEIYTKHMYRPDAPPLKVVVEDGSHLSQHMMQSMFFWFPRIAPGGMLIIEDIQPIQEANLVRTQFLPQIMSDLHFCGDPKEPHDEACFPQLYPYLQSIHCEMHICVFERNQEPAVPNLSLEKSMVPPNALDLTQCYSFANAFGIRS
jgi:hypothetical protein